MVLVDRATVAVLVASLAFSLGGLCMARAEGLARPVPSCGALALFLVGAAAMTVAVHHGELSSTYVIGLGIEAIISVGLGVMVLEESLSPGKLAGVGSIVLGIVLVRW